MQNLKLLKRNVGEYLGDLGAGDDLLDPTPKRDPRQEEPMGWIHYNEKLCPEKDEVRGRTRRRRGGKVRKRFIWEMLPKQTKEVLKLDS